MQLDASTKVHYCHNTGAMKALQVPMPGGGTEALPHEAN